MLHILLWLYFILILRHWKSHGLQMTFVQRRLENVFLKSLYVKSLSKNEIICKTKPYEYFSVWAMQKMKKKFTLHKNKIFYPEILLIFLFIFEIKPIKVEYRNANIDARDKKCLKPRYVCVYRFLYLMKIVYLMFWVTKDSTINERQSTWS